MYMFCSSMSILIVNESTESNLLFKEPFETNILAVNPHPMSSMLVR